VKNINSAIFKNDMLFNTRIKNHNEVEIFYPVIVFGIDGSVESTALFTENEIEKAIRRAKRNPEDTVNLRLRNDSSIYDTVLNKDRPWWKRVFFWL
jgi:hypothetical protein